MWTEQADLDCTKTTALGGTDKKSGKKNPTQLEGYYIGTRKVESAKSKNGFASLHIFQTKTGNVGVWGKTNLDQKMTGVAPGTMTRVSFVGMVETKNNPMYKYKVEVDKENTIEVVGQSNEAEEAGSYESESSDESANNEEYEAVSDDLYAEDEEALDVLAATRTNVAPIKAPAPTAALQKRAQEILRAGRAK